MQAVRNPESLEVMGKLLYNAAIAPKDEKFRRIKLSNKKIAEVRCALMPCRCSSMNRVDMTLLAGCCATHLMSSQVLEQVLALSSVCLSNGMQRQRQYTCTEVTSAQL